MSFREQKTKKTKWLQSGFLYFYVLWSVVFLTLCKAFPVCLFVCFPSVIQHFLKKEEKEEEGYLGVVKEDL